MNKLKKSLIIISILFLIVAVLTNLVYANNIQSSFEKVEYTEDYKQWLKLSDEEKKKVIMPRMYEIKPSSNVSNNLLFKARLLKSSLNIKYSLKDVIPSNLIIRNQQNTNSCWAFAGVSSLETNLAMLNYKRGINTTKVYDFSERHMEYANSKTFANNVENEKGYNREVDSGGNWAFVESYLTNGMGAINESSMPFENNKNTIDISQIQNKEVISQVYDTVDFPDYSNVSDEQKIQIMNQIKEHIQNYGSVYAAIHGNSSSVSAFNCYNNTTGAKNCTSKFLHGANHAVSIIGWDDNYSIENFPENAKPKTNGAWIVRNSWGERINEGKLSDLKEEIFNNNKSQCIARGWNSASEIPNDFIEQNGYTIENDIVYIKYGDNGIIYVSYEDCNIAKTLFGITNASDSVEYDNIYQYDEFYPVNNVAYGSSKILLCNIFDKKTTGNEYLTQVSLYAPETYKCKVYVNPNGEGKSKNDMQLVQLKAGETETFNAGYHTLEFSKPIQIKGNKFAVAIEIENENASNVTISLESKVSSLEQFNSVKVESGKCFLGTTNDFATCEWKDLSTLSQIKSTIADGDSSIKAFTVSQLYDNSLKNIKITTPPSKTSYFEGENFDKTGMVITANYNSKNNSSVILDNSSYNILNGTNLSVGQKSVTISYEGKSVEQPITVQKNEITELKITTPPTKTEYKEGQHFDKTGMVIEASYKDGTKKEVSDYTIENGYNVKADQTYITIKYGEKSVQQAITVTPNPLVELKVTKAPDKVKYIVGQDFDKTGMVITGTFQDESTVEIKEYTVENGTKLTKEQTSVIIKYGEKTVEQAISVEEKSVTEIKIKQLPSKLQYTQNKEELDLTGGTIIATYNDGTTEEVSLKSELVKISGFENKKVGKIVVTVEYQSKTTSFEVEIIEEPQPENSNFDKSKINVSNVKYYTYTDAKKQEYFTMDIMVDNIIQGKDNDSYEYYYYLSSNQDEKNIANWVKISGAQISNGKLQFKINTKDMKNYAELSDMNDLYLFIKEVAIKGGNQSIKISNAMKLDSSVNVETYLNNAKVENKNSGNKVYNNTEDNNSIKENESKKPTKLPNTGFTTLLVVIVIVALIGSIGYLKYKKLSKYIK